MSAAGAKLIIIRQRTATVRAMEILCFGDNFFQNRNVFRFVANLGKLGLGLGLGFRGSGAASVEHHEDPDQQEPTAAGSQSPPRSEPSQREDAQEDE